MGRVDAFVGICLAFLIYFLHLFFTFFTFYLGYLLKKKEVTLYITIHSKVKI